MNIVYLVFGENYKSYQQAYFSILTMLSETENNDKIIVITDNALYFKKLQEHIEVIEINNEILKEWEGQYKFFWRVKIKALQLVSEKYPNESICYLDSDTFLFNNLNYIKTELNKGNNLMHLNEGALNKIPHKTERTMWKQMKNKKHAGVTISEKHCMWNAGVVAISKKDNQSLILALNLCDSMCKSNVKPRLIEQFSFSVALGEYTNLSDAKSVIGHYWGNKPQWNEIINKFIVQCFMKDISIDEQIKIVQNNIKNDIPIIIKRSNTKERLINTVSKFFSEKETFLNE